SDGAGAGAIVSRRTAGAGGAGVFASGLATAAGRGGGGGASRGASGLGSGAGSRRRSVCSRSAGAGFGNNVTTRSGVMNSTRGAGISAGGRAARKSRCAISLSVAAPAVGCDLVSTCAGAGTRGDGVLRFGGSNCAIGRTAGGAAAAIDG